MRKFIAIVAIVALTGCASTILDDSDIAQLEDPYFAYACAAERMRVEVPGSVPIVVETDSMWVNTYYGGQKWVRSEYVEEINTVYIFPTMHHYATDLVHEMTHAIQYQRGEEYNEREARKVAYWMMDCVNF